MCADRKEKLDSRVCDAITNPIPWPCDDSSAYILVKLISTVVNNKTHKKPFAKSLMYLFVVGLGFSLSNNTKINKY